MEKLKIGDQVRLKLRGSPFMLVIGLCPDYNNSPSGPVVECGYFDKRKVFQRQQFFENCLEISLEEK
jgi:uncharacterized protein YodC (DUF2158 family)